MIYNDSDTIVAPATPAGGALCLIRLSGKESIAICDKIFQGRVSLPDARPSTIHYGYIVDGNEVVDDVMVSVFRSPRSFTGEDSVEISTHGSRYVVQRVITLLTQYGARLAEAGEFTRRAFLAGKMDLSQAEAIADIIAADSQASHAIASTQMRGAYSDELRELRDKLIHITSLLELELDFSEEDVEFADRSELRHLLQTTHDKVSSLAASFSLGNALKEGIMVAIAGRPNVGKSTLLNRLTGEDRAMVSDIAGTTRDTIEATANINGVIYRFIDTAGLHSTDDTLEKMGIERTAKTLHKAHIILWISDEPQADFSHDLEGFTPSEQQKVIRVINKIDQQSSEENTSLPESGIHPDYPTLRISAKYGTGVNLLLDELASTLDPSTAYQGDVIVSSQRHYGALIEAQTALDAALHALDAGISSDLLSEDISQVMHHIGTITGEITSEDILKSIFSSFCIGK